MSGEDPDKYYPYQTKGVRYDTPPSAADFPDRGQPLYDGSGGGSEVYEMDVDDDSSYAPLGAKLAQLYVIDEGSSESGSEISEEGTIDPGIGTFGVELEFLVVQYPRVTLEGDEVVVRDVHPDDPRWSSTKMSEWNYDTIRYHQEEGRDLAQFKCASDAYYDSDSEAELACSQYTRHKLTRVLRDNGLTVIKWPEETINPRDKGFVHINDFSETEASEDELEEDFPNSNFLGDFSSIYEWEDHLQMPNNINALLQQWQEDFAQYHKDHGLKFHRTRPRDIDEAVNRCTITGWSRMGGDQLNHLRAVLRDRLLTRRTFAKQARENTRNLQVDPLHVDVPDLKQQYKAWTVTVDLSVDGNGMTSERYANANNPDPFELYAWFGAEVVSPVFPLGDEQARQAIRDACGALRDALRCHKPMEVSSGLHVHLGHTKGWTLFQAKRFATLWFLAEKTILKLHRKDRDADIKWCAKIGGGSRLWRALYSNNPSERRACASSTMVYNRPAIARRHSAALDNNVPNDNPFLTEQQKAVLHYIWQYESITALHSALGENYYCRTGVKWRIRGKYSSLLEEGASLITEPGTIEVRIMHGTLDADHINNWVTVLERITHAVRDLSDANFKELINQFLLDQTRDKLLTLLGVPDDIRQYWQEAKRRDANDMYWEYPDKDLVDWRDPFMVPGYKATHGAFWD